MNREYWFFLAGMLAVALPLLAAIAIKKLNLFEVRPDNQLTYKTVEGRTLSLHAFLAAPSAGAQPRPAVLLFHGGRWLYGSPRAMYPQCRFFAAQGYHCFAAEYRLGANNRVDVRELVSDAADALGYLHSEAGALAIDTSRIVVGGGSAGGHLAAALGAQVPASDAPAAAALLLYNPMLDLAPGTPDHHLVKAYWREVSPAHHVTAALPPTLVLVGSDDPEVPLDTVNAFCANAQAVGARCEVEVYPGQSHGFFNAEPYLAQTNQRALAFLQSL